MSTTPSFAVVFDLDGLLVDSEPLQAESFNMALAPHGITLTEADFEKLVGIATIQNFRDIQREYRILESVDSMMARKNKAYKELIWSRLQKRPSAGELVEALASEHVPMAVASSSVGEDVRASLQSVGLLDAMSHVVTADDVARTKPAPDLYQLAAQRLGMSPRQCIAFEDAGPGVVAATQAGIRCIAVPNIYTARHDFSPAVWVTGTLEGITPAILRRFLED